LAAGLLLSLLIVIALPGFYFQKDLETFWKWAQVWKVGWSNIYIACPECNYPILGMFSSAGLMAMLSGLGYDSSVFAYRLFLGMVDGLNIYLIFWIIKRLKVAKPAYLAGIIGISISSWAGGAVWGQIDGLSQLFILLSLVWLVYKNTLALPRPKYFRLYPLVSSVLMACLLLTKQLTIFSAFSLGLLLAADILFNNRTWKTFLQQTALAAASLLVSLFVWDLFLKIKPPYFSHLFYIWLEGVFQSGIISGNGFNIWMLSGRDMWSSAHVPLFAGFPSANPYLLGELLFLVLGGIITLSLALVVKEQYQNGETFLNRETLLNFILHLALINLCFNVFLTGTRERYLFHFYPYIILAWAGLAGYNRLFSEKILSILFLGANLYGLFILQILSSIDFRIGTSTHIFLAVFHLALFAGLMFVTLKYQKFAHNLRAIFRRNTSNLPTVR
jgi:hypothetical protein